MKIRALVSFSGNALSMAANEVLDCDNNAIVQDLLSAGYVEKVTAKSKKDVTADED